jgi:hypothetical protein
MMQEPQQLAQGVDDTEVVVIIDQEDLTHYTGTFKVAK